ncbi:MAG: hypothetical protein U9Q80_10520 [Bacillota bacterium]|nr:hypothetical protein [Bacillota bacterium]
MKISFGVITKDLIETDSIDKFLDNAEKYFHPIYSVIITYSRNIDNEVVERLRKRVNVEIIKINDVDGMCRQLSDMEVSEESIENLLNCKIVDESGMVPYGKNRNNVIMKGMLTGVDVLVFIDTDVYPELLVQRDGYVEKVEVDFIGRHLEYLKRDDVSITTSDYSGYYIIPPMRFDGMDKLFSGIQKESIFEFLNNSHLHKCFIPDNFLDREPFETDKILGGNVAIKLSIFEKILPFFSSSYVVKGERYLTRGEDTLMGIEMSKIKNHRCMDIDTRIFHDTYSKYPLVPDILNDEDIKDRFFYACMGWIGRNPFLNWIHKRDIEKCRIEQRDALKTGAKAAADYLNDDRFLLLEEALEISYDRLDEVVDEYKKVVKSWREFIERRRQIK